MAAAPDQKTQPLRRWLISLCVCAVVLTAAWWLWVQKSRTVTVATPPVAPARSALDMLYAACVSDMIAKTCKVMGTPVADPSAPLPKPGEMVFIAGVGAIAATDYAQMYAAGDAMCSVLRDACTKDWGGGQCRTARSIYRF